MVSSKKGFSIVICTYNGASRLKATLTHIAGLMLNSDIEVEIIVVDNASTDNTQSEVSKIWQFLQSPHTLKIIEERRAGKGYAIETGYDNASFKYILTVDDDNWLDPGYLLNAYSILESDSAIGALQANITGVFEETPPEWFDGYRKYFIIGSVIPETGYLPPNNCWLWGAGMVIRKSDWTMLRSLGFSFLTSKVPGKAAGEDNELAIALLLLGRRFYYSEFLRLEHFMPKGRLTKDKLKQNFEVFGYVSSHLFLYKYMFDSLKAGEPSKIGNVRIRFIKNWLGIMNAFSLKQHYNFFIRPKNSLDLVQYYAMGKSFLFVQKDFEKNLAILKAWMVPLLHRNPGFISPL